MDKKQEIIEAAFELFCAKGYHLAVSELAKAVAIKTPSLYSHFSSKDQILEIMIQQEINHYFSCLESEMMKAERLNCKDAMKSLLYFVMDYFGEYKRLRFWRTIPLIPNEQLKKTCSLLIAEKDRRYNQQMQECFTKGIENGEIKPEVSQSAFHLYFYMIQGVLDGMLLYPKAKGENTLAMNVFKAYWDGICAKPDN